MKKNYYCLIKNCLLSGLFLFPLAADASICTPVSTEFNATTVTGIQRNVKADANKEVARYLLIWDVSGGSLSFPLEEHPRIVADVEQGVIKCVTRSQELSFFMKDVHKYTLDANPAVPSSVENASAEEQLFHRQANSLLFENLAAASRVRVCTLNGSIVKTYSADEAGRLTFSMEGWNAGVYLIKTDNVTYKVIKK